MEANRRQFLTATAAATAGLTLPASDLFAKEKAVKPLNILFLGGTGFIGPHMVRDCVQRGHKVTLFNRGSKKDMFPELETIVGDRDPNNGEGLNGLKGRTFDCVVDTSGYLPRHVEGSAELLKAQAKHYLFISTVAVYDNFSVKGADENHTLGSLDDPTVEEITGTTYGPLKVYCEQMVTKHFPDNHTILRPTYIIGPGDHTDRFIHYIDRPMKGGRMAMPGTPDNFISYVDVRDLAAHTTRCLENGIVDTQNMVSPPNSSTWGEYLDLSLSLSKADVDVEWLPTEFLKTQEGFDGMWSPFPMWMDNNNPTLGQFSSMSQTRAIKSGFSNRPFRDTVVDSFNWWMQQSEERRTTKKRDNFPMAREESLLKAWDEYNAKS